MKIFKPILIALSVTILLHLISVFVIYALDHLDNAEIQDTITNLPLSFSLFFIPIFFSLFFFDKNKSKVENIFKPALISMVLLSLFEIIFSVFFRNRPHFSYFDATNFRVFSIGFFISFFITIIKILANSNLNKKITNYENIKFPWRLIFLIPFIASTIYSLIIVIASSAISNLVTIWFSSFPLGVILTIISFHFFKKLNNKNRNLKIVSFYVVSILIFVAFWILSHLVFSPFIRSANNTLFMLIVPSIVLFSPYFLFIVSITHLNFLRIINNEEKRQLTQQSFESQLNYQQLKNQLSPHFLFNNINVLTSLIEENPKKAVQFSENLSNIYRYFLEQEKQDVVLVKDEINFAKSYLELLKDRFEIGFNYSISVDEDAKEKYIVSTILQQVLENVVKHNTINESNYIDVKIISKNNFLIVENNKNSKLKTIQNSKKGIENIKKRIAFFTDEQVIIENTEIKYLIKLPILEKL
ncbi:histidine kinase [Polaribacter sp. BAL334]|nr:histidine kinase [Polaribacter sp. BAL334]